MIAFTHIEKTAGNTITGILRRSFGPRHCDARIWRRKPEESLPSVSRFDLRCSRWVYWNLHSAAGHLMSPYGLRDDSIWFFTFLREPIMRCVSHYQFQVREMGCTLPFDRWISNPGYHNLQTRRLAGSNNLDTAIECVEKRMGFVGLVDRFDESLVMLQHQCPQAGLDARYRPTNVASDNSIKNQLLSDSRAMRALKAANESDVALYRYVRSEIFPRQLRRFGTGLGERVNWLRRQNATFSARPRIRAFLKWHMIYRPLARLSSGSWWF